MLPNMPPRIAVVAPIMVKHDAISLAVRDTMRCLSAECGFEAIHFGSTSEYPDIPHRHRSTSGELLRDPDYYSADAAIFHFGIHHSLFDALLGGGPRIKIVVFHNVTPTHLGMPHDMPLLEKSHRQINIFRHADEIWAVSPTNAEYLMKLGFPESRIKVIPLIVEDPPICSFKDKAKDHVSVLYIGRIAPAKGPHDLINAIGRSGLPRNTFRVTIAGNTHWSDAGYIRHLQTLVTDYGLEDTISFKGTVDDNDRNQLLRAAHIIAMPSYHEGFCRPIAEGFRAGCIPLVYDAYNLPRITGRLGCVVPTGDTSALGAALSNLVASIPEALAHPDRPLLPLDRAPTSVNLLAGLSARRVREYSFDHVASLTRRRLLDLLVGEHCVQEHDYDCHSS